MDPKDFDHIPYDQLSHEQQEARKASRAHLVSAAMKTSDEIDRVALHTVRGLNILQKKDEFGMIVGQVFDRSELSRQVMVAQLYEITIHFLGLSNECDREREEINVMLKEDGDGFFVTAPSYTAEELVAERSDVYNAIMAGDMHECGLVCQLPDEESSFCLCLVKKDVAWDNDEDVEIIQLSDPDFNLIIDYTI